MKKGRKSEYLATGICIGILLLFLFSIGMRFCVRQILVKRLGIENAFTHLVFWDNKAMLSQDAKEETIAIDWAEKFPFDSLQNPDGKSSPKTNHTSKPNRYVRLVKNIEENANVYSNDLLAGYLSLVLLHQKYQDIIGWKKTFASSAQTLYMKNGYFTNQESKRIPEEIQEMADSVLAFSDHLKDEGISFYYVNAGSKVNPIDKQLFPADILREFTNENGDALLKALSEREINTLDMREYMLADGLDWYDSYYKTDHHWNTETGLWAAGVIAKVLNEREGFSFDPIFFDKSSYQMTMYENCFLGTQGRGMVTTEREGFTCILPKFETNFSIEIPTRNLRLTGSYKDTLFDYENLENVLQYSQNDYFAKQDAYGSVAWKNDALGIVKNKNAKNNADKKILMIQDSFSWYSTTYLACDVGEVHMIHLSEFDGSLRAYVKEMKPDVVIVMYCEKNITPIDWTTHNSMFDFR